MDEPLVVAVGSLTSAGAAWVGFARDAGGYHLVCADDQGVLRHSASEGDARTDELLLVAIAHYQEALEPPLAWEATQADLAELLGWLASSEANSERRAALARALDAIDDGLAGDAVAGRLWDARPARGASDGGTFQRDEPADLAGQLAIRCRGVS